MILTGALLGGLVVAWCLVALILSFTLGLAYRQAMLYVPFKLVWRIRDRDIRIARQAGAPVIYAIVHQSRLDPALMLSLLPENTLHILDEDSAKAGWLEPWRDLARTIAFNAEHVFVSRRFVRVLRGKGNIAVYFPDSIEPDTKSFRLFRAVARIASQGEARIVPIIVDGARFAPLSLAPADKAPRSLFRRLSIRALPPLTVAELVEQSGRDRTSMANALFDRIAEVRAAARGERSLFNAMRRSAELYGPSRTIVEDVVTGALSYRELFIAARVVGNKLASLSAPGEAVGIMLPTANGVAIALLGLASAGRVAAMVNYTAGPANVTAAVRTGPLRIVVSSRAFVEKADLGNVVEAVENGGGRIVWLEDIRKQVTAFDKATAALLWRLSIAKQKPDEAAVILFTSGSEGLPKAVVLSNAALVANADQIAARLDFSPADKLFNVLPVFHSFGLMGGLILPLLVGVRTLLYPSPLHYKLIPETAAKARPTIMFGTDTFLAAYAKSAKDDDFSSLRLVVAGAEPVRAETRRTWKERFGADIVEGFGMTEAAPVVAVNSATHGREGSVGRLLPGMRARFDPVEGIADAGRLWVSGPNLMTGYMTPDKPGVVQGLADGWHDSGDIVAVDREGFLTIRGRAKRFAKIAGEMVSLGAIEMLVQALWPEDRHAAVAVPDKRRGERIVLVTTAAEADPSLLKQHGKKAGATQLMIPDDIIKVEEMPLLGTGKTDYASARRLALGHLGLDQAA
jgi:acyl-[acyl-carrier-protein]-phospholipid O-acyltransferase/long-chain-fatty-acid--[acyl-carrier-protein] ligase